jgi:hypothetical protein
MLFQDWTPKLRGATKSIEAVDFTEIGLLGWLNPVNRAIFTARVSRIAPLMSSITAIGCCSYGVIGLLVSM